MVATWMPEISVATEGVTKLLQNSNPCKTVGLDYIPCRLLRTLAQEIMPTLTTLFSKSIKSGEVPTAWRHAHLQPVFKKP